MFSFVSCNLECVDEVDFEEETRVENENWRAADIKFNESPTEENCLALTKASDRYVESLNGVRECVPSFDLGNFLERLTEMEDENDSRCN